VIAYGSLSPPGHEVQGLPPGHPMGQRLPTRRAASSRGGGTSPDPACVSFRRVGAIDGLTLGLQLIDVMSGAACSLDVGHRVAMKAAFSRVESASCSLGRIALSVTSLWRREAVYV